jgi:hypothetical protein
LSSWAINARQTFPSYFSARIRVVINRDDSRVRGALGMIDNSLTPQILQRAYEIWESEGRPHGRDKAHWFMAKAEVANSDRQPAVEPSKPKRKSRSATARPANQSR